jgi:PAS domain S-box-containing protein
VRDARVVASVVAGLALVVVVGFLVVANYRSARTLRENLLSQRAQQAQLRAAAVGLLLAGAQERLANLADSREVAAFHENRDLGMSMEYGLALSLVPIHERLVALATRPSHGAPPAFERVVMFAEDGEVLSDSADGRAEPPVRPGPGEVPLRISKDGRQLVMIVRHPFKGNAAGALVGWLRPLPIQAALGPISGSWGARLIDEAGHAWLGPDGDAGAAGWPGLAPLDPDGQVVEQQRPSGETVVAARARIPGQPLWLVQVDRAEALLGRLSPTASATSLSAAVLLVLAVAVLALFLNVKALVLQARLQESLRREREVEEKHQALEREVAARQRLEQAQAQLARAVDQADEAIAVTDATGRLSYVNPAFERITLWPSSEILGRRAVEAWPPAFEGAAGQALRAAVRQDQPWKGELLARRRDGAALVLELVVSPVHDAAGTTVSLVTVARDLSEERRLVDQLRHAQKLEAVGTLASGVAHDFNNLLAVIRGNAVSVRQELGERHPSREDVDEILRAAQRAADLTRQLLTFGRQQAMAPEVVDLDATIQDVEKMLRRLIREDIELETSLGPGRLRVRIDPGQLEQVLMNLVVNARDAIRGVGRITLSTAAVTLGAEEAQRHAGATPGDWARLRVEDDGDGMDQETMRHLFEPFFTTKEVGKGTGLGLSVVYGIVRQSHGFIEVESERGKGAAFTIWLPAAGGSPLGEAAQPSEPLAAGAGRTGETVLVVEDEPQLLRLLRARLAEEGFEVLTAADGQAALEVAARHQGRIDVLLTDVVMPRLSGPELAERFVAARPGALVVFMSGHADEGADPRGRIRRAAAFVQKPEGLDDVAGLLRRLLDGALTVA